jgi:DNA-binding winged helix-turn-helix (wHTH) protein/Flp pilus assembly protein TadD
MPEKITHSLVRFGPYEADFAQGELRKHGIRIKIQAKPLAILGLLVRKQGDIVSRDELKRALWPDDVFVDFEKNLSTAVNKLRTALSDSAHSPRYVETAARRGYRFLAPVELIETDAVASSEPVSSLPSEINRPDGQRLPSHRIFWIGAVMGGAAVIVFLLLSAFWPGGENNAATKQTESIVLGDFQNSTGDAVFDNTLRQGLASQLDQSPFLNLVSDTRVRQTLALMAKPEDTALTPEIARGVCQRTSSKAYVAGAIGTLGNEYVIQLKAVNCANGTILAEEQMTAESKKQVVGVLGRAVTSLRREMGESLATIQTFDVPLDQATTPSLDALRAYTLGQRAAHQQGAAQSLPYDQQAIAMDPNFAMAYEAAGIHYSNLGEPERAATYLRKAFDLREHASERERLKIEAFYYSSVTGELEKAAASYKEMLAGYPRDVAAYNNLGIVLAQQGRYEEAVNVTQQGMRVAPEEVTLAENLSDYLLALNRLDETGQIMRQDQPKKPDNYIFPAAQYALGFLNTDSKAMADQEQWFAARPAYASFGLALAADTAAYGGQLSRARDLTKRAVDAAVQADARETAAIWQAIAAQREAAYGLPTEARRSAVEALGHDRASEGTEAEAALAFALAGDAEQSEPLARDLSRRFPLDTQIQSKWLPAIHAQLDLNRKDPSAALKVLQVESGPIEFGAVLFAANASGSCLYPTFIRGQAYLDAGQGREAATEFQKIRDHGGIVWNCWTGALARLGIARASALEARTRQGAEADAARVHALAAYRDFLGAWEHADPEIPLLKQAKAEYAKLR